MVEVKDGGPDDVVAIADALVSAFHDDPVMLHIFRNERRREKKLRALFATDTKRAFTRGTVQTTADGAAKGAAVWMAPNKWRAGGAEIITQLPLAFTLGLEMPRALALLTKVEKVHPKEPHWYLAILGTATEHQGKGVGSALLGPVLARCDAEGLPAYLESSKEANIPFYKRHGFEVMTEVHIKDGPSMWPMWRDPRPPES